MLYLFPIYNEKDFQGSNQSPSLQNNVLTILVKAYIFETYGTKKEKWANIQAKNGMLRHSLGGGVIFLLVFVLVYPLSP